MSENKFEDLKLHNDLLKGVYLYGFKDPSLVQINGIKSILTNKDCIIQSQSGTGKTATYLLGILNKIKSNNMLQGIILAPTRELANQIFEVCTQLSKFISIKVSLCIGGSNTGDNKNNLSNCNLIIGTLGRIWYLVTSKFININYLNFFIIDEVDDIVNNKDIKLPHMGWNDVKPTIMNPLLYVLENDSLFYFLHSYYFSCNKFVTSIFAFVIK
jgi:superfamily II DNA/RNA helicase